MTCRSRSLDSSASRFSASSCCSTASWRGIFSPWITESEELVVFPIGKPRARSKAQARRREGNGSSGFAVTDVSTTWPAEKRPCRHCPEPGQGGVALRLFLIGDGGVDRGIAEQPADEQARLPAAGERRRQMGEPGARRQALPGKFPEGRFPDAV